MTYLEIYNLLKSRFNLTDEKIDIPELGTRVINIPFESFSHKLLPGEKTYQCNEHNIEFKTTYDLSSKLKAPHLNEIIETPDSKIKENINFNYSILIPIEVKKSKKTGKRRIKKVKTNGTIILLHGLNEKDWSKYLPWAYKLMEQTGKQIVLFPIAFHMNRTPAKWIDPRFLRTANKERKEIFPNIANSSFANIALSARLQFHPQRFLWSGLQSFYDVMQLIHEIKSGLHPLIKKKTSIDFFAYSIGSFLANILFLTNSYGYLSKSKLFHFCGGPTLNRMNAASKYILDSEANISVYSFYVERLEEELKKDDRLKHYFSDLHPVGKYFKSMLEFHKLQNFREKRFKELNKQISAVALKKDVVVPPSEVLNTLKGSDNKIPTKVKVMDFNYNYDHVIPFPPTKKLEKEVDKSFNRVFRFAAKHLK
ncbi:MAG: hypothetical protein J7K29_07180 [Candidatus Cloacimonetes bacterium]|nr:hypothetical protein [Candidatus Cloacimonadota bacterium]